MRTNSYTVSFVDFLLIPFPILSRDDKRYTEKKNKSERARRKKEDIARLRSLVDKVFAVDPRIKRIKQEEKEAREAKKKKGKTNGADSKAEAEKKKQEEEAKKKEEEEKVRSRLEHTVAMIFIVTILVDISRPQLHALPIKKRRQQLQMQQRRHVGPRGRRQRLLPHKSACTFLQFDSPHTFYMGTLDYTVSSHIITILVAILSYLREKVDDVRLIYVLKFAVGRLPVLSQHSVADCTTIPRPIDIIYSELVVLSRFSIILGLFTTSRGFFGG